MVISNQLRKQAVALATVAGREAEYRCPACGVLACGRQTATDEKTGRVRHSKYTRIRKGSRRPHNRRGSGSAPRKTKKGGQ